MREYKRSRNTDVRYRQKQFNDAPTNVDIGQSIRETRSIYKEKDDETFIRWYSVRYGVRPEAVRAVLNSTNRPAQ